MLGLFFRRKKFKLEKRLKAGTASARAETAEAATVVPAEVETWVS
jgi:hypothetical protein